MYPTLVKQFIESELDHGAREALKEAMKRAPEGRMQRDELTFNRFNVLLDFERGTATISDDLDVSADGTIEMSIGEFERLLNQGS